MAHNQACANARNPGCSCSGCGGSLHGWPGHLDLANEYPEERASRYEQAYREWCREVGTEERERRRRLASPTEGMLHSATTMARIDIAGHLAARPATVARIRELGLRLNTHAFVHVRVEARRRSVTRPETADISRVLPGHFWCSLLTVLVEAADRWGRAIDKVPVYARELVEERTPPGWGAAQEAIADTALEAVWRCTVELLGLRPPEELLLVMRVLALFVCPDPGRHPELLRVCLSPLQRGVLQETTTMLLRQSLVRP